MLKAIDRAWLDARWHLLSELLGDRSSSDRLPFEPSPDFYALLGSGENSDLLDATALICKYIHLNEIPQVSYEWGIKIPSGAAGLCQNSDSGCSIKIPLSYVGRSYALGAILSHEIAHAYIFQLPMFKASHDEHELMTDLTLIYLGLGILYMNGIQVTTDAEIGEGHGLGYLDHSLVVYGCNLFLKERSLARNYAMQHLNENAKRLFEIHSNK